MTQLLAFLASLLRWPDGVVVKQGNTLRTQASTTAGEVLCDETGRMLLDESGAILYDAE